MINPQLVFFFLTWETQLCWYLIQLMQLCIKWRSSAQKVVTGAAKAKYLC